MWSATATAEYLKPLSMGSPSNQYGNDPDAVTTWPTPTPQKYPNFWANVAGGTSSKQNGDAYAANSCNNSTDGCNGSGTGLNLDYKSKGYYYTVDFTGSATANLQVFDPAFVARRRPLHRTDIISRKPRRSPTSPITRKARRTQATSPSATSRWRTRTTRAMPESSTAPVTSCFNSAAGPQPKTTYTVWKAVVPGDPGSAQQVCAPITYPGTTPISGSRSGPATTEPGARRPCHVLPPMGDPVLGVGQRRRRILHPGLDRRCSLGQQSVLRCEASSSGGSRRRSTWRATRTWACTPTSVRSPDAVLPRPRADRGGRPHAGAELLRHRRRELRGHAGHRAAGGQQPRIELLGLQVDRERARARAATR